MTTSDAKPDGVTIWPAAAPQLPRELDVEARVEALLEGMSLEAKVGQIIQPEIRWVTPAQVRRYHIGSVLSGGGAYPGENRHAQVADWLALADSLHEASLESAAPLPLLWGIDAVHGHTNIFGATIFPHNINLGATRNPQLMEAVAAATAREIAVTGLDWSFSPTLAVVGDDRWGRTYESFSESAEVVSSFAAPAVTGTQGAFGTTFADADRVIGCAKHFIGDGGTEGGVDQGDTVCDERELLERHGHAHVEAIRAGVQTVMVSFSSWNGSKVHGNRYLVTDVLKQAMGFDGFVIGDWNGHGQLPGNDNEHADMAINAGVDMIMVPEDWEALWHNTLRQVGAGTISLQRLDDAVRRILRVKLRFGIDRKPPPSRRPAARRHDILGCAPHRALARRAARESMVLLKNSNGLLPLAPNLRIAVAGNAAEDIAKACGGWTLTWQGDHLTEADFPHGISVAQAIRNHVENANGQATVINDPAAAADFDVLIMAFGEEPYAEGYGDRHHLSFSAVDSSALDFLRAARSAGTPVVSVFFSGRPLWVNPELNASDAFVAAFLPGSELTALADLLFEDAPYDFAGRLGFSWPSHSHQTPLNHGDEMYEPLFPLGFGLKLADVCELGDDLDEHDVASSAVTTDSLEVFNLRPIPPFVMMVGDPDDWRMPVRGSGMSSRGGVVSVNNEDWLRQEDARRVKWSGGAGQLYFQSKDVLDCSALFGQRKVLEFKVCVHSSPTRPVKLRIDSVYPHGVEIDITDRLTALQPGEWHDLCLELTELDPAGHLFRHVTTPFLLYTEGEMDISLGGIRLGGVVRDAA